MLALFKKVIVIFLIQDENLKLRKIKVEKSVDGNLIEHRVYYPMKNDSPKILRVAKYFWLLTELFIQIKKQYGLPRLVHINVIGKSALLALILKKIKKGVRPQESSVTYALWPPNVTLYLHVE